MQANVSKMWRKQHAKLCSQVTTIKKKKKKIKKGSKTSVLQ
jgi:hypothetical protein